MSYSEDNMNKTSVLEVGKHREQSTQQQPQYTPVETHTPTPQEENNNNPLMIGIAAALLAVGAGAYFMTEDTDITEPTDNQIIKINRKETIPQEVSHELKTTEKSSTPGFFDMLSNMTK